MNPAHALALGPFRVLLLDDDPSFLDLMEGLLAADEPPFDVRRASCAAEALDLLETFEPDVMVVDLCLPDIHGVELVPHLLDLRPQAQVVVSTGHGTDQDRQRAFRSGVARFVEKPFQLEPFRGLLADLASHRPRLCGAGMALSELAQMMTLCAKTAEIRFQVAERRALLHFQDGALVHVLDPEGEGEPAFFRVAAWGPGQFHALKEDGACRASRTIQTPTLQLLMRLADGVEPKEEAAMLPLKDLLKPLLEIDGTKVAVLVDWDGFVIEGVSREGGLGTDALGAVISTVLGSTQVIGRELGVGATELAMLEYERGCVLFRVLGKAGILAVLLENQASLGLLRFQIRKRSPEIEAALF